jgi:hypothetical protein
MALTYFFAPWKGKLMHATEPWFNSELLTNAMTHEPQHPEKLSITKLIIE